MKQAEASRHIRALVDFRDSIAAFLRVSRGNREEWAQARARVDRIAPKAARAFDVAGVWVDFKPAGTFATQPVNPALIWQACFEPDTWFPLDMLDQLINRALGSLEDLRDNPPTKGQRVSLQGFSFGGWFAALLYTTLSGLIVAGLAYLFGWVG